MSNCVDRKDVFIQKLKTETGTIIYAYSSTCLNSTNGIIGDMLIQHQCLGLHNSTDVPRFYTNLKRTDLNTGVITRIKYTNASCDDLLNLEGLGDSNSFTMKLCDG